MTGDIGLLGAGVGDKFGDIAFPIFEGGYQFEAHGFAQDAKAIGDQSEGILGQREAGLSIVERVVRNRLHNAYITI